MHSRRVNVGAIAVLAALTVGACTPRDDASLDWDGSVVLGPPIEVQNPERPLLPGGAVRMELAWTVQDDPDRPTWERPRDLAALAGRLFVLDPQAARVHVFAVDGSRLGDFGGRGGGPGRFEEPMRIMPADGRLAVLDGGKGSLELLSPSGEYLRSLRLGMVTFAVDAHPDGDFFVQGIVGRDAPWMRLREDGTREEWTAPPAFTVAGVDHECAPLWTVGGVLARTHCYVPEVRFFDDRGGAERVVRIDREPDEQDAEVLRKSREQRMEGYAEAGFSGADLIRHVDEAMKAERFARKWHSLRQDESTGVYLLLEQDGSESAAASARLHLLSPEGVYLAALDFPTRWVDYTVADGVVYALVEDSETGLIDLHAYRIELPDGALDAARDAYERALDAA